ncbi:MAG: acyl-CoA thioesterase [Ignavibacteriales bacterium]|nr:acyl-CoA thioesterase [Ignavibacteriales bacterium]
MFTYTTRVNFYDADPAGILFFANVFKLAHSTYEDFMARAKFKVNYFTGDKYAIPIIHTGADYIEPIFPDSTIKIQLSVTEVKNSSFVLMYDLLNSKDEVLAKCKTVHVFIEKNKWKKVNIPAEVKKHLRKYLVRN